MQRFFVRLTTNPEPIIIITITIIVGIEQNEWTGGAKHIQDVEFYICIFDCIPTRIARSHALNRIIHPAMRPSIVLYFLVNIRRVAA